MPYNFDSNLCKRCPFGHCFEDRRARPVPGRKTEFRVRQQAALECTFEELMPGIGLSPDANLGFNEYLDIFRSNIINAGNTLIGDAFAIKQNVISKVEGDIYEILLAAVLWNVAATWNNYMENASWDSVMPLDFPQGVIAQRNHKLAIVKLPRNYDSTRLFSPTARENVKSLEEKLESLNMELGLSAPDIVGIRLPDTSDLDMFPLLKWEVFSNYLTNLNSNSSGVLESGYRLLEGQISTNDLLFAIAVKRTMRSDRLYQPLFEANVLKYLVGLLGNAHFKFFTVAGSTEGADVEGHYRAVSLVSLIRGEKLERAIDKLIVATTPIEFAKEIYNQILTLNWDHNS